MFDIDNTFMYDFHMVAPATRRRAIIESPSFNPFLELQATFYHPRVHLIHIWFDRNSYTIPAPLTYQTKLNIQLQRRQTVWYLYFNTLSSLPFWYLY
jgi:hypothetical protein